MHFNIFWNEVFQLKKKIFEQLKTSLSQPNLNLNLNLIVEMYIMYISMHYCEKYVLLANH